MVKIISGKKEIVCKGRRKALTVERCLRDVLQGSVIGPILFITFINDVPDEVKWNLCKPFADDCKLCGTVKSVGENQLQRDLQNLVDDQMAASV